tara:strand:+ start:530 stop:877 length:348 start_codon:yes stop_codon:yes gene_type:complete
MARRDAVWREIEATIMAGEPRPAVWLAFKVKKFDPVDYRNRKLILLNEYEKAVESWAPRDTDVSWPPRRYFEDYFAFHEERHILGREHAAVQKMEKRLQEWRLEMNVDYDVVVPL